jgi:rubrerythrin
MESRIRKRGEEMKIENGEIKLWVCEDCGIKIKSSRRPKSCSCGKKYWYNRECKAELESQSSRDLRSEVKK